jgi:hypothetical protein
VRILTRAITCMAAREVTVDWWMGRRRNSVNSGTKTTPPPRPKKLPTMPAARPISTRLRGDETRDIKDGEGGGSISLDHTFGALV